MRHAVLALLFAAASTAASAQTSQRTPAGHSLVGLPALNFDADEGMGYGALLQYYEYGEGASPYRYTIQPTVFLTTKGRKDVSVFVDDFRFSAKSRHHDLCRIPALLPGSARGDSGGVVRWVLACARARYRRRTERSASYRKGAVRPGKWRRSRRKNRRKNRREYFS